MTFDERLTLIVVSAAIGVIISMLLHLIVRYLEKKEKRKAVYYTVGLLASNMVPAIANNESNGLKPTVEFLLSNFHLFCSDDELNKSFRTLHSKYVFLCNKGYESTPDRREPDINEINNIADTYKAGSFHEYPVFYASNTKTGEAIKNYFKRFNTK